MPSHLPWVNITVHGITTDHTKHGKRKCWLNLTFRQVGNRLSRGRPPGKQLQSIYLLVHSTAFLLLKKKHPLVEYMQRKEQHRPKPLWNKTVNMIISAAQLSVLYGTQRSFFGFCSQPQFYSSLIFQHSKLLLGHVTLIFIFSYKGITAGGWFPLTSTRSRSLNQFYSPSHNFVTPPGDADDITEGNMNWS